MLEPKYRSLVRPLTLTKPRARKGGIPAEYQSPKSVEDADGDQAGVGQRGPVEDELLQPCKVPDLVHQRIIIPTHCIARDDNADDTTGAAIWAEMGCQPRLPAAWRPLADDGIGIVPVPVVGNFPTDPLDRCHGVTLHANAMDNPAQHEAQDQDEYHQSPHSEETQSQPRRDGFCP